MKLYIIIAKLRVRLARWLNRALLGRHAGGLPGSVIRSLEEIIGQNLVDEHVIEVRKVSGAEVIRYAFPDAFPALCRREKAFDAKYVYVFKNVIVSPSSGMVWTPNGYIFQESVGSLQRIMHWGGVLHEPLLSRENHCIEEALISCPDTGYFHWLLEIMPNMLNALKIEPEARILVSPDRSEYVTGALEAIFGESAVEERCIVRSRPQTCACFLMHACDACGGFVLPQHVELLRNTFQPENQGGSFAGDMRIYVSRRGVTKRTCDNEQELEEALKTVGFQIVRLEQLGFCEQIELMGRASMIVAMHGAGLSNMIWARKPCSVVELFPIGCYNDCFARLALTCGYDYHMIRCDKGPAGTHGRIAVSEVVHFVERATAERASI